MIDLERLRRFALSLPGATEDIQWEHDLLFRIGGKMFFVEGLDPESGCGLKVTPEEFGEMIERRGIKPSAYLARYHWISIARDAEITHEEIERMIRDSHGMVAAKLPKKLRASLGLI